MAISKFSNSSIANGFPKYQSMRIDSMWQSDPHASRLVLAAPFNTELGINDYDASISGIGSNKTGTAVNGAAISTNRSRFYGSSLDLGLMTEDKYVHFGNDSSYTIGTNDFTIEGWWFPTSLSIGYQCFASHSGDTTDQQNGWIIIMEANNSGPWFLATDGGGGWPIGLQSSTTPTLNAWNHIAITRQGNALRMFVNGVQTASQTTTLNIIRPSTRPLHVGLYQFFPGEPKGFQGSAQDFRMYIGVAKYTANFTVPDKIWLG